MIFQVPGQSADQTATQLEIQLTLQPLTQLSPSSAQVSNGPHGWCRYKYRGLDDQELKRRRREITVRSRKQRREAEFNRRRNLTNDGDTNEETEVAL